MKSVRLDAALETKLKAAARMEGISESQLIRQAIGQHCDAILANRADLRLAHVVGIVHGGGGRAENVSKNFADLLQERHEAEVAEHAARQGVGT